MVTLLEKRFDTPLGPISCGITSTAHEVILVDRISHEYCNTETYLTCAHQIELLEFGEAQNYPRFKPFTVNGSHGWIWKIERVFDAYENLQIFFKHHATLSDTRQKILPQDYIEVIEVRNASDILCLGGYSNDMLEEMLRYHKAAGKNDKNTHALQKITEQGFVLFVPFVTKDITLRFQFIAAFGAPHMKADVVTAVSEYTWNGHLMDQRLMGK